MITETCTRCDGAGYKENKIDGEFYPCACCGGHGETPVSGDPWFYRSREGKQGPQIAHIHPGDDGHFIIDFWDERGPRGKSVEPAKTAFYALRHFKHSPNGTPKLLDYWSNRPAWQEGLKQLEVVALFNLLSVGGFWREACEAHGRNLDETLANLKALKAAHMPNEYIF